MSEVGPTQQLAHFVAATSYADLPPNLIERAKVYVLDNFAAGFVGSMQPWSVMVAEMVRDLGGAQQASVFNRAWRTDASRATLANGAMMGAFEAEHIGHVAHPSATVFPAALAMAEHTRADGPSFLLAMLLGYEVVCRVGEAQTRATEDERGFHNPGVDGAFGAAAAVGKLLGLNQDQLCSALGIAGSHACGLVEFIHEGAMTKRLHPGRASQLGLESALLARRGFTGPSTILEGRFGYLQAYSPRPRPERLVVGLGQDWLSADLTIKAYPCHSTGQAVVEAIQHLKRSQPFDPRAIRQVKVDVDPRAAEGRHLDRAPRTLLGAQYSLPFSVAVALVSDLANPYAFDEQVLSDPLICELAQQVVVEPYASTGQISIEVGDREHRIEIADFPGSPTRPLDFAAAADKLRHYASPAIGDECTSRLVELTQNLERLEDVNPLAEAISASAVSLHQARG